MSDQPIKGSPDRVRKLRALIDSVDIPNDRRDYFNSELAGNYLFKNVDEEPIPPFAVMMPVGQVLYTDDELLIEFDFYRQPIILVTKYRDPSFDGRFLINGQEIVEPDQVGKTQTGRILRIIYEGGDGTGKYAPKLNEWFVEPVEESSEFQGIGYVREDFDLLAISEGGDRGEELVPIILTENIRLCGSGTGVIIDPYSCVPLRDILLYDAVGMCNFVSYPLGEEYAPENAMGWAKRSKISLDNPDPEGPPLRTYDIVSLSMTPCCAETNICPEIPFVPWGKIGIGAEQIKYVLGYDEDGCLVRITVGTCCEEEEPEPPPPPIEGLPAEGLIAFFDGADGTFDGSTWTDLSGNNNDMTMTGSPTRSSDDGGKIEFTTSQKGELNLNYSNQSFTLIAATRYKNTGTKGRTISAINNNWLMANYGVSGTQGYDSQYFADGAWIFLDQSASFETDFQFKIYAVTEDNPGNSRAIYTNNSLTGSGSGGGGFDGLSVATGQSEPSDCEIGFILLYDRVLTTGELTTIFDLFKDRYGL